MRLGGMQQLLDENRIQYTEFRIQNKKLIYKEV